MHMKNSISKLLIPLLFVLSATAFSQTIVPNGGFELWKPQTGNYRDPEYWDSPNKAVANIPFIGVVVVSRSTDHVAGVYSVKLETQHLTVPPLDVPGFITLGTLDLDIYAGTYNVTGGVPITDNPTHLKGFYKYLPQGGDTCIIGIGMFRFTSGVRDTIGAGYFSEKDTISDWTPFSAWIEYVITGPPDSMNIFAVSSAQEEGMHSGTTLYLDDIELDYTLSADRKTNEEEIRVYHDRETGRLLVFFDFVEPEITSVSLFNMQGLKVNHLSEDRMEKGKRVLDLHYLPAGVYLLEVVHSGNRFCKKIIINH